MPLHPGLPEPSAACHWIAQDANGWWWAYAEKPEPNETGRGWDSDWWAEELRLGEPPADWRKELYEVNR